MEMNIARYNLIACQTTIKKKVRQFFYLLIFAGKVTCKTNVGMSLPAGTAY